jgi:CcmD family protein
MSDKMILTRRFAATVLITVALLLPTPSPAFQPKPPQQEEFVPIDQLPPQDQLPAAPLLIGAYVFVWLAVGGYIWSVARRVSRVQREVERLDADLKRSGRA